MRSRLEGQQFVNPVGGQSIEHCIDHGDSFMREPEDLILTPSSEDPPAATPSHATPQQTGAQAAPDAASQARPNDLSRELTVVPLHLQKDPADQPHVLRSAGPVGSRFAIAAAAAFAVVISVTGALIWEHRLQANFLAQRANETETLAQAVGTLKARLDAIDTARSSNDLADLRRSIGEMKSTIVSAREFNGALAQLSQRVDKLDHEEGAKVDKLSERVDHETSALTAEISARVEKLEKKIVAPVSAPTQAGQPAQASLQPKFGASVSMETTGSIERPKPVLRSYIVLDARDDVALVGGRYGEREVRQGDFLPGAGRVERIERKGGSWIVLTSEGLIPSADLPPY